MGVQRTGIFSQVLVYMKCLKFVNCQWESYHIIRTSPTILVKGDLDIYRKVQMPEQKRQNPPSPIRLKLQSSYCSPTSKVD